MPVNTESAAYKKMSEKWKRCRDVASGQDAVHEGGEKYLPKLKSQDEIEYNGYRKRTSFYNATWRTIAGLSGMMFRKPPTVIVPATVEELLKNSDGSGTPFGLLLARVSVHDLTVGRIGALVDYPTAPDGITAADEQRLNLRPYIKLYATESIINWRMGTVNNVVVPVLVVLKESAEVVNDEFTSVAEDRWRVLDLVPTNGVRVYRQRVFKRKESANANAVSQEFEQVGSDVFPKMSGNFMDYIPFEVMNVDSIGFDVDDPPLIDLVDVNLSHYRTNADYEHGCHFTAMPTLFLAGFTQTVDPLSNKATEVYVGGETAVVTSNSDAKGQYIEFSGAGLSALERNLDKKEKQMAVLGARMLEEQKSGVESAETAGIHRAGEQSALASIAIAISLGMTRVLKWFTLWAGQDASKVSIEVNRDFFPKGMTPQMLAALIAGWQQGVPGLSDQGIFDQLKAGEIVADNVTLEEEQARILERQQQYLEQQLAAAAAIDENLPTKGAQA